MRSLVLGILITAMMSCTAFAQDAAPLSPDAAAKLEREKGKVTGIVKTNPDLTTLANLLIITKLDEDLADPAPSQKERFSLFAPTNEAFLKMPKGVLDDLMKPENAEKLKSFLNYHVIVGKFTILPYPVNITARNGDRIAINASVKGEMYGTAKVENNPAQASNGVVYIIDTVQMPPEKK